jgi:hypothetical protein
MLSAGTTEVRGFAGFVKTTSDGGGLGDNQGTGTVPDFSPLKDSL